MFSNINPFAAIPQAGYLWACVRARVSWLANRCYSSTAFCTPLVSRVSTETYLSTEAALRRGVYKGYSVCEQTDWHTPVASQIRQVCTPFVTRGALLLLLIDGRFDMQEVIGVKVPTSTPTSTAMVTPENFSARKSTKMSQEQDRTLAIAVEEDGLYDMSGLQSSSMITSCQPSDLSFRL